MFWSRFIFRWLPTRDPCINDRLWRGGGWPVLFCRPTQDPPSTIPNAKGGGGGEEELRWQLAEKWSPMDWKSKIWRANNSWQQAKYAWLYPDLLMALQEEPPIALSSQQRGPWFPRPQYPTAGGGGRQWKERESQFVWRKHRRRRLLENTQTERKREGGGVRNHRHKRLCPWSTHSAVIQHACMLQSSRQGGDKEVSVLGVGPVSVCRTACLSILEAEKATHTNKWRQGKQSIDPNYEWLNGEVHCVAVLATNWRGGGGLSVWMPTSFWLEK